MILELLKTLLLHDPQAVGEGARGVGDGAAGVTVSRTEFQALAKVRLTEAKTLLDAGSPAGAYYLAGYVVECALKACLAKNLNAETFPPKPEVVRDSYYTHNLRKLLKASGLEQKLKDEGPAGSALDSHWSTVLQWDEQARYEQRSQREARELYTAVADEQEGVFQWLQRNW